jgi:hypothetical protein
MIFFKELAPVISAHLPEKKHAESSVPIAKNSKKVTII